METSPMDLSIASFHPVHRLDRLTSGLVIIAKNPWVHQQLSLQLESKDLSRFYLAICRGSLPKVSGKINVPIKETPGNAKRTITADGKPAQTRFRTVSHTNNASLAAIRLYTGRTHQIRVHFAHLGFPLWGDPLYGIPDPRFTRPALHAAALSFIHPRNRRRIRLKSEIPADFNSLLTRLGFCDSFEFFE